MNELETVYTSNIPIDCHIIKGRLETEGINCYINDENIVWVHPFKAVAVGGVKLKVLSCQSENAKEIINLSKQDKLFDKIGESQISNTFEKEIAKQNKEIELKAFFRDNPSLLDEPDFHKPTWLKQQEFSKLVEHERTFQHLLNKKLNFNIKQFLYELFDFDRSVFKYLRTKPVEFYIEKELVDKYLLEKQQRPTTLCPKCKAENVCYGYAIDYKLDIIYILLSLIISPLPLWRKKYHCFTCGTNFKKK